MKMQGNGNKKTPHQRTGFDSADFLERVKGVEPSYKAWEAFILPLNYTRNSVSLNKRILANCLPHCQHRNNHPTRRSLAPAPWSGPVAVGRDA